jgi:gliding motility-associated-like protein
MLKRKGWLILLLIFFCSPALCQQDVDFHIGGQFFTGKKVLKVSHDFNDPYLWVLTANNGVYRINSQTLVVDDYSSNFSAYSADAMIAIAGKDQNNSAIITKDRFITFLSGTVNPRLSKYIIGGTLNSVACDNFRLSTGSTHDFCIGSAGAGYYYYDISTDNLSPEDGNVTGYARIYEATYKSYMRADYFATGSYSPSNTSFVDILGPSYNDAVYIWRGGQFGENPNTAFYTSPGDDTSPGYYANLFWGTDDGFFDIWNAYYDQPIGGNYNHLLSGMQVNKITDLFGLLDLNLIQTNGNYLGKETLLIGASNGFYFSRSILNNYNYTLNNIQLFHYALTGDVAVNDICVNGTSTPPEINAIGCEDAVWVATDNGLFFLKPDYGEFINADDQLAAINFDLPNSSGLTQTQICLGSSVPLNFNAAGSNNYNIQWQKNGVDIVGQTGTALNVAESGDYNAIIYESCDGIHISTNHLKVTTISGPIFTFNYPPVIQNCNANPVPLTVTNDLSYHYRWYTNGVLNGDTTNNFTATQSGQYYVEVSACTNSWVPSSKVQVSLVNLPVPAITGDKTTYCQGDAATLSANVPVDQSYTINWYKNGTPLSTDQNFPSITTSDPGNYTVILTGTGSACTQSSVVFPLSFTPPPTFTFNYPASLSYCAGSTQTLKVQGNPAYQYQWYNNGTAITGETAGQLSITQPGTYNVQVSSCPGSWVPSSTVAINFIQTPVPTITTDKPAYCVGDNAALSVDVIPDPTITVNWYRDNVLLPEFSGDFSIMTNVSGTYTAAVVGNAVDANGNVCSSLSSPVVIGFNPAQVINIQQTANNGLCAGQSVTLKAIYTTGTIQWSTGETTDEINVTTSGTYAVTLTTSSGCTASSSQTVAFLPLPVLNLRDTAVCFYKQETAALTAPAGFAQYTWNNQGSGPTYTATQPGTVTLTVTDANGCQATQRIQVADLCPEVEIPNTFTPNGDNVNDTWVIQGLDGTGSVKIFNRYGTLLYKNTGYYTPWDGTYNGKKVPAGVYYYIITTKSGNKKYSGSVMVLY